MFKYEKETIKLVNDNHKKVVKKNKIKGVLKKIWK